MKPKFIMSNDITHTVVNGRDILRNKRSVATEQEDEIKYPLRWMLPVNRGVGIGFGDGVSYQTGEEPDFIGNTFPALNRICLVESLLPVIDRTAFNDGVDDIESFQVSSVGRSSYIGIIPSPYESVGPILKYPDACVAELIITVLAYYNPSIGFAIGEKVRYVHATDPDIFIVSRYPYQVAKPPIAGYSAAGAEAEEYYYTEQEMSEAE